MRRILFLLLVLPLTLSAQRQPDASEIRLKLKKLNFLGSVLYMAAHPDDENTRVIAYLANDRLAATAYLSVTRGDGGQNLIGPEIRDELGLIRTQELLAARRIDGGQQFFTRANDFGFSKDVNEAFEIWNKDEIMSDVIKVIRMYKPDVIITRFPPTKDAGHGHHTGSAVLAQESFDISGNANVYPETAREFGVWQPRRVFTNTGRWWNQTINENTPGVITLNVGSYNVLLGKSYSEIAAESRTQHKSQGFGSPGRRGDAQEFFELAKGDPASKDIFDGVNTSWSRVKGGEKVQPLIEKAIREYKDEAPYESIKQLLLIRKEIATLEPGVWRERKLAEVNALLVACAGLYSEVTATEYAVAPGEGVKLQFEIVNRSPATVTLKSIQSQVLGFDSTANMPIAFNKLTTFRSQKNLKADASYSSPYWLREEHTQGLFTVNDKKLISQPENTPAAVITLHYAIEGEDLSVDCPVIYKWTDPVKGELTRPFEIVPPVTVSLSSSVYLFKDTSPQQVTVLARSSSNNKQSGVIKLKLPDGWKATPPEAPFTLGRRGAEEWVSFTVTPGASESVSKLVAVADVGGKEYNLSMDVIAYDHIPAQTLIQEADAKLVRVNIARNGSVIGYIRGAGDEIPTALRGLGYEVWEMKNEEVTPANLAKVDAVVLGVRALNTNERIRYFMPDLLNYVKNGGTMVVQYNTNFEMKLDPDKFSPYPLKISRDRVTEENSEVRILNPSHPALNEPNKITAADFNGWVQERGLYYPGEWDPQFVPLISANDKNEKPLDGGLLVAKYGNGHYVYTGLSFFRELPEGVPGAYKLFANLVSLGKSAKPKPEKVKSRK